MSLTNRCIVSALIIIAGAALTGTEAWSAERDASQYVGTKSCRMCHKKEATGDQYGKWQATQHAKAYETLATDEAKAVAAKQGVDDPQTSGKCLKCHSTAYNGTEEAQTEKVAVEDGVTCESCHGPGKNYKSKTVMEDREKCIEGGMIYPATQSCVLCHNDTSPTWKPDRYTSDGKPTGFDVEQAHEKIKHPNPAAQQ